MDAKTKRRLELNKQIEDRKDDICKAAIEEFIAVGIDNAKISDIAKRAEVGAATVYRYFDNKTGIVIEAAARLWSGEMKHLVPKVSKDDLSGKNGFEQVKSILTLFGTFFKTCPQFLRLLEEFDNFIVRESVSKELLHNYEANISDTEFIMLSAIEKGQRDGTIKPDLDPKVFYVTATHAITSLSQKLLLRGNILESDSETSPEKQLSCLIEMELAFIKA